MRSNSSSNSRLANNSRNSALSSNNNSSKSHSNSGWHNSVDSSMPSSNSVWCRYRQQVQRQDVLWAQRSALLQQQKRAAQYRFQQTYLERRRQQIPGTELRVRYDYNNDANFYSAANYRYARAGRNCQTNQYGADLLRQSVNYGYDEGFQAGQADREDRWRASSYQSSYAYQDANYGYNGYYVSQAEYSYYFREGFRRGYEDGYNSRSQYGGQSNGNFSILTAVLYADHEFVIILIGDRSCSSQDPGFMQEKLAAVKGSSMC